MIWKQLSCRALQPPISLLLRHSCSRHQLPFIRGAVTSFAHRPRTQHAHVHALITSCIYRHKVATCINVYLYAGTSRSSHSDQGATCPCACSHHSFIICDRNATCPYVYAVHHRLDILSQKRNMPTCMQAPRSSPARSGTPGLGAWKLALGSPGRSSQC